MSSLEGVGAVARDRILVVEATTVVVASHGGGRCRDTVGRGRGACRHQEEGRYPDFRPLQHLGCDLVRHVIALVLTGELARADVGDVPRQGRDRVVGKIGVLADELG